MGLARTLQLRPEPLPAQGDLTSTPFAVLLGWARALGVTGVLSLSGERFVFFLRGTPVHVDSLLADETSEVYLKTNIPRTLEKAQLEAARATARDSGRGVGEALLGLGWLDPSELFEHKKAHAREKLISCFESRAGSVRFEPRDNFGSEFLPIPLDVPDVLREGVARYYDRKRLDRELPIDDLCRVGTTDAAETAVVATEEARVLQLAGGRPTLRSLATEAGLRPDELRRRLYALYCLGLVSFELGAPIAEESAAEQSMDHPLPVPKPGAPPTSWAGRPPSSGSGAGSKPVQAPSPTPAAPPPSPTPRPPATATPAPPTTPRPPAAASTPRPPVPRPPTAPAMPRPQVPPSRPAMPRPPTAPAMPRPQVPPSRPAMPRPATPAPPGPAVPTPRPPGRTSPPARRDPTGAHSTRPQAPVPKGLQEAIESAEIARANEEYADALEILRAAHREYPGEPRLLAQLALTMVLFDERQYAREANQLARKARTADPTLPLPYVVMGILLEQIGQTDQAAQMYRHALARDRDCAPASQRLGLIEGVKATK